MNIKMIIRLVRRLTFFSGWMGERGQSHCDIIIIIIISQTATTTGRATSYTPAGTSRENSPVRKKKRRKREKDILIQLKRIGRKCKQQQYIQK